MSLLFGGRELICDGCVAVWPSGSEIKPGSVIIDVDSFTGVENFYGGPRRLEIATRHYCPACASVALDAFKAVFERLPVVRNLAEPEPGDVQENAR